MTNISASAAVKLTQSDEKLIRAMEILGDKTRFKIFKLLITKEEMCVSEIAEHLDITLSAVSQHFRNFEMAGLVEKERMGQKICYALKQDNSLVQQLVNVATTK